MAERSKRLPRAVREQQMLDAAVEVFSRSGFHDTSMDSIAKQAEISKPMLYLYYGSKDELFAACIHRESRRFIDAVASGSDPKLTPKEQLRTIIVAILGFVSEHRQSWRVLYREATADSSFAKEVFANRGRIVEMVATLLRSSTRDPEPGQDFDLMATALVGAGEAVANRVAEQELDADAAADLLVNLGWRGLAGPRREHHDDEVSDSA
ncbi:TetR/AcrR family transcriptional regulator [Rhodococcus sp. D2-41]|uniref:TetR/AcrR family transcriptional regulator n=1 Tax=Speluncibacter jeojiensis TaxID=2710754 RepID=A0A9X4REH2_9ACTN|nr:TetR/AcrR family transcriptional regulator [Rhodococcus sp. D2-41]MDG3010256.1 TetR/AcrR family transcriptional regulator [Rhodococcus sp. D2-41]MDG3015769.1 TetR/AcrR family transcriptional regulator [Corynebacteriales bacterium D3-21]